MRPLIGITTRLRSVTASFGPAQVHASHVAYTAAVTSAGGLAMLLPPAPPDAAAQVADRVDGLVLSGGGDVNPAVYGGADHESLDDVDDARDGFEIALVRAAEARRLPLLAVCRGLQVLNVGLGGTLAVDLPGHPRTGATEREQRVALQPGSRLAGVLGEEVLVNSIHHQAVDRLAPDLRVVGRADDGVVEAVEPLDATWPVWAVQWHPELFLETDGEVALFAALVAEAGGRLR